MEVQHSSGYMGKAEAEALLSGQQGDHLWKRELKLTVETHGGPLLQWLSKRKGGGFLLLALHNSRYAWD